MQRKYEPMLESILYVKERLIWGFLKSKFSTKPIDISWNIYLPALHLQMNLSVSLSLATDNYNTSRFLSSKNDCNKITNLEHLGLHMVLERFSTTCVSRTQKSMKPDKYK